MTNPWLNRGKSETKPNVDRRKSEPVSGQERSPVANAGEVRWYGLNAIKTAFARRPDDIRKVYVSQSRLKDLGDLLKWCAENRVGYRVVDDVDLEKLAKSQHHEGVVADIRKQPILELQDWIDAQQGDRVCALWLDGVGNPHNLGAIIRSAAHFGATAILVSQRSNLMVSGAAARVAEGGAEYVQLVHLRERDLDSLTVLKRNEFSTFATVVEGGNNLFETSVPPKVVFILGAEGEGMDRSLAELADQRISIPGTGNVESLNVANAAAVLLSRISS